MHAAMPEERQRPDERLHLPDLSITGFRGIRALAIPRLGRVTLLAGMNGVGKTTVLEACRIYAARGRASVLSELAGGHEEYVSAFDEDRGRMLAPDLSALFHGRDAAENAFIEIGCVREEVADRFRIEIRRPSERETRTLRSLFPADIDEVDLYVLRAVFRGKTRTVSRPFSRADGGITISGPIGLYQRRLDVESEPFPTTKCMSLGPGLLRNDELAAFWDSVTLTEDQTRAEKALGLVLGDEVERVAMVGDHGAGARGRGRRAIVKLVDHDRPVPLKSLGDGATRLFGFALALANCRGGLLLIDEAENGIHHTVHENFWRMMLKTARANDVQVLATTHGWDCIRGFAQAATADGDAEGVLVRLEKDAKGRLRAVEYSEEELETAAEQGIEVR